MKSENLPLVWPQGHLDKGDLIEEEMVGKEAWATNVDTLFEEFYYKRSGEIRMTCVCGVE